MLTTYISGFWRNFLKNKMRNNIRLPTFYCLSKNTKTKQNKNFKNPR